jgi:hypothetical protein
MEDITIRTDTAHVAEQTARPSRLRIVMYRVVWFLPARVMRQRIEDDADLRYLSAKETRSLVDQRARTLLGMTREEVLEALDKGSLPDSPAADEIRLLIGASSR